ncbi:DUF4097 family beta strand repeat-containing protein [Microbacterium panaciterrae]|uniref:DUF4097 domain-containing protein n=1 Tax=Microbacterium panaciterrae TaxID=985759 RepID=A0ABP8PPB3_9MICO
MTNLTPPRPPQRGAVTAITVVAIVVGALSLAVAGGTAAVAATTQAVTGSGTTASGITADVQGVRSLNLDASAGSVSIRFGDVTQATLRSEGQGNTNWKMQRVGDTLQVRNPQAPFGWWFNTWFQDGPTMTLTLPKDLEGTLNADLTLDAGALDAAGDFDVVTARVSAGQLTVDGAARTFTARVDAGAAHLRLRDVGTADLTMSAGQLDAAFTGSAPDDMKLDVSAGSMDVTVPSGTYALSKDVSAGTLDARIPTDPSAAHRIQVNLSAGGVTLHSGS